MKKNKTSKYFKYAIGEIILVVIGILIALQINNWNESKKKDEQFALALEQVFNDLDIEIQDYDNTNTSLDQQITFINQLLYAPDSIPLKLLPYKLFYIDQGTDISTKIIAKGSSLFSKVELNLNDIKQLKIAKKITSYLENRIWIEKALENEIEEILKKENIPTPIIVYGLTAFNNFEGIDINFFTNEERLKVLELVKTPKVKTALKTIKSNRLRIKQLDIHNTKQDALSLLQLIKDYDSNIRLFYDNVGIIGTAIDGYEGVGVKSIPMQLIDEVNSIWETEIELKKGTVKFRTRDSWIQNWGGTSFPKGDAIYFWENIEVKPGKYKVIELYT
tara:strand:+ start:872 stop:1870 length:999 start_codon:yes stop_codon:yes gene_type:complete